MKPFTVIYEEPSEPVGWQFFECHADDADHAKEQCINAYPTAVVLWVCTGRMAHEPYYGDDETW